MVVARVPAPSVAFALAFLVTVTTRTSRAQPACVERLNVTGLNRTRESFVRDLLPREFPICLSSVEVAEYERRLWDAEIFDDVAVSVNGNALDVAIREKWTLIPGFDFSSAQTLRDSYFNVSLTEFNMLGRGSSLAASVSWIQRGLNLELSWSENEFLARKYSFEAAAQWLTSDVFFESRQEWSTTRVGASFGLRPNYRYNAPIRMVWNVRGYHEQSDGQLTSAVPRDGVYLGAGAKLTWDKYEWSDLTPHGYRITAELNPGILVRRSRLRPRHELNLDLLWGHALGERTVLVGRTALDTVSPGDPNHAVILGTADGVRGLPDNLLRNAVHVYANLEIRHALKFSKRLFLQVAAFTDAAVYVRQSADGTLEKAKATVAVGAGLRLVPTFLSGVVPRVDAGGVVYQGQLEPFIRFSTSQYF
jgi:hypothetical protein